MVGSFCVLPFLSPFLSPQFRFVPFSLRCLRFLFCCAFSVGFLRCVSFSVAFFRSVSFLCLGVSFRDWSFVVPLAFCVLFANCAVSFRLVVCRFVFVSVCSVPFCLNVVSFRFVLFRFPLCCLRRSAFMLFLWCCGVLFLSVLFRFSLRRVVSCCVVSFRFVSSRLTRGVSRLVSSHVVSFGCLFVWLSVCLAVRLSGWLII